MCLIAIALRVHPLLPLVLLANRDERYDRPSLPAAPWPEDPRVLGGRDLTAGGTWLAVRSDGRFAAVANRYRRGAGPGRRSRGELPAAFVLGEQSPADYLAAVRRRREDYAPFNLLLGDRSQALWFESERGDSGRLVQGLLAIGNGPIRAPWPKAGRLLESLARRLAGETPTLMTLLRLLADGAPPAAAGGGTPPGEPPAPERAPVFLAGERFGTRASTVVTAAADGRLSFAEVCFGPAGRPLGPPAAWRGEAGAWTTAPPHAERAG